MLVWLQLPLYVTVVAASSTLLDELPSLRYSTESVNVVLPDFVVDSTRYTREPLAGAVNEIGRVTREPSGMVRGLHLLVREVG
ncbi:hypothetical protein SGFS_063470 [Streptomyces graminofaciens]|uniref:Uncharacterized protein n=1 Tax=Streptomyces graminofaciens TaxID=68212 RepID=A0ABM7FG81_9ACTN|nr:hypothetical protein SGFS_063470 [Streptomyces graminofaciens]